MCIFGFPSLRIAETSNYLFIKCLKTEKGRVLNISEDTPCKVEVLPFKIISFWIFWRSSLGISDAFCFSFFFSFSFRFFTDSMAFCERAVAEDGSKLSFLLGDDAIFLFFGFFIGFDVVWFWRVGMGRRGGSFSEYDWPLWEKIIWNCATCVASSGLLDCIEAETVTD